MSTKVSNLPAATHLFSTTALWDNYNYPYFTDKGNEAQMVKLLTKYHKVGIRLKITCKATRDQPEKPL